MSPHKIPSTATTDNVHAETDMDMSLAGHGIWLVKVPKYIARKWENAPDNMNVGKMRIEKKRGKKPKISMTLAPEVQNLEPINERVPMKHDLYTASLASQRLGIFSHDGERGRMEGKVIHKLDCRPVADENYIHLKKEAILKATVPQRKVQILDRIVNNFKPVSNHKNNIEYDRKKKEEGKKMRDAKNVVADILFNAFEKHQFYNIKDLVQITKQPVSYLKEILREYCDYNMKHPHKNMWELKKEYRHYKLQEETA